MAKLTISLDGTVVREVALDKDHMALGRRPYNHIVIDNLAVSGDHAIFQCVNGVFYVEDMNSTNGTTVNGICIRRQALKDGDVIGVAKYRMAFSAPADDAAPAVTGVLGSRVQVLSGASAGRSLALTKAVTTLGKPGVAVASIARRGENFVLRYIEGVRALTCNGQAVSAKEHVLAHGDVIDLAGVQMRFEREDSL